jgi:hypothetical protein
MGRIIKKRDGLAFAVRQGGDEVALQEGTPVLWFTTLHGCGGRVTGRTTLRALAHAILEAYPDAPKKGRKR